MVNKTWLMAILAIGIGVPVIDVLWSSSTNTLILQVIYVIGILGLYTWRTWPLLKRENKRIAVIMGATIFPLAALGFVCALVSLYLAQLAK